jgi:hypothetical protein
VVVLLLIVRKPPIINQRCFHFKFKEQLEVEVGDVVIEEQKADVCVLEWLG